MGTWAEMVFSGPTVRLPLFLFIFSFSLLFKNLKFKFESCYEFLFFLG
jgi:hypothetical protein